jgi:hypothetical protein
VRADEGPQLTDELSVREMQQSLHALHISL